MALKWKKIRTLQGFDIFPALEISMLCKLRLVFRGDRKLVWWGSRLSHTFLLETLPSSPSLWGAQKAVVLPPTAQEATHATMARVTALETSWDSTSLLWRAKIHKIPKQWARVSVSTKLHWKKLGMLVTNCNEEINLHLGNQYLTVDLPQMIKTESKGTQQIFLFLFLFVC